MNCEKFFFYKEQNFNNKKSSSNFVYVIVDISGLLQKKEIKQKLKNFIKHEPRWNKIIKESFFSLYWENNNFDLKKHFFFKKNKNYNQHLFINKILNKGLKKDKPMWKLYMINDAKNTHLIFKCHHIYGDGYYLMKEVFIKYFIDHPLNTYNVLDKNKDKNCIKKCKNKCFIQLLQFKKLFFKVLFFIFIPVFLIFFGFYIFVCSIKRLFYNFNFENIFDLKKNNKMKSTHLYELDVSRCKALKNKYGVSMNSLIHFIIFKTIQNYKNKNIKINYITTFSKNMIKKVEHVNTIPFVEYISMNEKGNKKTKNKMIINKENKNKIKEVDKIFKNYKLLIYSLTGHTYFSNIYVYTINKYTKNIFNSIYNSYIDYIDVGISNFHSFLKVNKINNKEILNIQNFVVMHEMKLLFNCCSYDKVINLNIIYQNNILNYKKLRSCLKNVLLELSY